MDALDLPLRRHEGDEYYSSENVGGAKHFGVWPLSQAAQACFGTEEWPPERTVPQVSIEFEVADAEAVEASAAELAGRASTCFTRPAPSRGAKPSRGCSRPRARSSGSPTHPGCTADRIPGG